MDEERLDPRFKNTLIAYFEGWELVELLEVPIEVVIELLEETIIENIDELQDYLGSDYGDEDE